MAEFTIDGQKYDTEQLSESARNQITSLQFVDSELARKHNEIAVLQTARVAYAKALKDELSAKN